MTCPHTCPPTPGLTFLLSYIPEAPVLGRAGSGGAAPTINHTDRNQTLSW